ncbi:sodium:solute symporter family transporter [Ruminococcus flavefaciens]|jgi:hypothetical protein|uniref:Sodium:solute symporter family protein n=1 Tax=Ruminococcus flavefaciens TaxID=1265 RepID=A0A1K1Q0M1_RUMFL|nr:hypothetical protein [Ruminococcus flavefaciens]SFW53235.1 Sodium:solute symporter family protein [Ruminococcus flavefaciens]
MKAKKKWYDHLWIFSITYLILGFVNILFAWLGMICFIVPLVISIGWGNKAYCNKFCGRGQLFSMLGGHFGLSRKKDMPKWMKSKYFRYGFLVFFFTMFFIMLWNTYLVFAGILACTMSTSDSQLLAASSSMSENILKGVFNVKMSDKASMLVARVVLLVIAVCGVALAWDQDSSVFRVVSFAWAGFGATFGPVMLAALFWKRSNKWGAIAGLIVGAVMVFVWKFAIAPMGGVLAIYELLPAFLCAFAAIIIVSLVTGAPETETTLEYETVKAELNK